MKGFKKALGLGLISRLLSIVGRFLSVPLTASLLSGEQYGLWLIVSSLVGWLAISDLGIPSALQNRLIQLLQNNETERAQILVGYALKLLGTIGLAISSVGIVCAIGLPWRNLFPISDELNAEFVATLSLCIFGFAIGLPTRIGVVLYNSNGKLNVAPLVEIAAQSASLVLLLISVALQWSSLFALCSCMLAGVILGPVAATYLACKRFGYTINSKSPVKPEDRQTLLIKGAFFAIAAVGELLILQSDSILIGSLIGPAAIPSFAIPATLFINFLQVQNVYLRPVWPLITSAIFETNSSALLYQLFRKSVLVCVGGACIFAITIYFLGDWFIKFWSNNLVGLPPPMAFGFGLYAIIASVDSLCATFLNAAGKIEYRCGYTLLFGILKASLALVCIPIFGLVWLPLIFAVVMLITSIPFALYGVRSLIRST